MIISCMAGMSLTAYAADEVSENISLVASQSAHLTTISGTHYSVSCGYMEASDGGMTVNSSGALTINARKGETITKVVLTYSWGNNKGTLSASAGTFDGNATVSGINAQQVTIRSSSTAGVKISAVTVYFEGSLSNPTVTLSGGANATSSGGLLTQSYLPGAMDTVTYTALTGATFPEFEKITQNGITVERTSETVVTVSGTPTANTEITVPDAESSSKIVTWGSSVINNIDDNYTDTTNGITLTKSGSGYAFLDYGDWMTSGDVTLNFTTTTGKFSSIEIVASTIYDGGNWTKDGNKLKWNGTPSNSVSLSGSGLYLEGVSSINFVIEMPADLSNATVTLGADNTVSSVTVGGNEITDFSEFDITYGTDDSHTATTPPTADGTYYAYVAAKTTSENYTGTAKSAAFSISSHAHSFTYSASGATITANCSAADCPLTDHKATLTIVAPTLTTYGGTGEAAATLTGLDAFNAATGKSVATTDIKYVGRAGTTYAESATTPTSAGKYTAKITVEEKTASVDYEIAKADPGTPTVTMSDYTYGGTVSTPSIGTYSGGGTVTYYYNTTDSTEGGTAWTGITATTLDAATYYMYAVIAGSDNYSSYTTATTSFTVSPGSQTAPAAPTKASATTSSITLNAITNGQYKCGTGEWQDSPTFTGLSQNTSYTFYQRLKATTNYNASPASEGAAISTSNHTHTWGYEANGATITASCNGTGTCDITTGLTLTIIAPTSLTYDGTAKAATLSTGYNTTAFPDTYTITYTKQGDTSFTGTPTAAGTYTASVTAGTATASVTYTIAPKTVSNPTIEIAPETYTYTGQPQVPTTITVKDGTTTIDPNEYTATVTNNVNAGTNTAHNYHRQRGRQLHRKRYEVLHYR